MKFVRTIVPVMCCWFAVGVACRPQSKAVGRINDVVVTEDEIDAFMNHFVSPKPISDKTKLNYFVRRKIMLLEARSAGLDKSPDYLEQLRKSSKGNEENTLIASYIDYLNAHDLKVSESEIENVYIQNQKTFAPNTLAKVHDQIRYELQKQRLASWMDSKLKYAEVQWTDPHWLAVSQSAE
jgi:hypothetical protein